MLIVNQRKKFQKISCKKSIQQKSDRKIEFLTFITLCAKVFYLTLFWGDSFCAFFKGFELSIKFCGL
jgi:hypothetical protein